LTGLLVFYYFIYYYFLVYILHNFSVINHVWQELILNCRKNNFTDGKI